MGHVTEIGTNDKLKLFVTAMKTSKTKLVVRCKKEQKIKVYNSSNFLFVSMDFYGTKYTKAHLALGKIELQNMYSL